MAETKDVHQDLVQGQEQAPSQDPARQVDGPETAEMETQFSAILSDAAKLFANSASQNLEAFTKPPMKSVDDLKRQLDVENDKFAEFRAKRHAIFDSISMALKPVELVGDLISGAASEVFAPSQNIYSAVMYLVNAAHNVSSTYDSIIELFAQLKDFTSRLEVYAHYQLSVSLREKLVTILASLFEVLVLATREVQRGRIKAYFKNLFGSDSPIQPALEKLKSMTLGESRQVLAETYGGVSQINIKTDQVRDMVTQMNQTVQILRTERQEQTNLAHQDRPREILNPSPFPEDFYDSFAKFRVNGTGEWILEDEGLQAWLRGETRYVWMNGGPGTGKSFLTSRLITWGLENVPNLAYFFFRDNNPETRSVLQALRDVAYQLSENDVSYAKELMQILRSSEDIKTIASTFRKLFVQPDEKGSRDMTKYIFLDGIDEADPDEMKELLELLAPTDDQNEIKIQIALVGRSYLTETVTFALDPVAQGHVFTTVHVTTDRNAQDVKAFIMEGISHSRIMFRTTDEFKKEVMETMEKQVDGLFILAKFMLAEVNRMRHARSILKSLESYPKEINGMLQRTLTSLSATISHEEVEDLNEMLRWVSCAQETMTLEQLEAALILRFGDPPIRLEEALRGQYSCFFELEREDGFTTDDLVKEYERQQRDMANEASGSMNNPRGVSPTLRGASPQRVTPRLSPRGFKHTGSPSRVPKDSSGPRMLATSPPGRSAAKLSPTREISPARSPDMIDPVNDMEFRSNKSTTFVSFFHTSVRTFFRDENSTSTTPANENSTIGFDTGTAKLHILRTCLRIFNDKDWFEQNDLGKGKLAIRQYAAWYWQEHLRFIDPTTVSTIEKGEIGKHVYKMLTDEHIIFNWSIMYEKNNEGLEVLTDANIDALQKWMGDPDVHNALDEEAREWAIKAAAKPSGIAQNIGRLYAKAWLMDDFHEYSPTTFCFKIVQTMAYMDEGYSWTNSNYDWYNFPVEKRIARAAEWADCPQNAHWHRRVGSTYLVQNLHGKAMSHYQSALEVDHNRIESCGRIAYCLSKDKRYEEALKQALECADMEEEYMQPGNLEDAALARSKWRLYKDHNLIATCYSRLGKIPESLEHFRKAMACAVHAGLGPDEVFESEVGYLEVLATQNHHADIMDLLQTMAEQDSDTGYKQSRLIDLLLHQYNRPLVMDWMPKAARKVKQVDFLIDQLGKAITTSYKMRDPLRVLYLRLSIGTAYTYNREIDEAISIFEQISFLEYRPRGNILTRQGHAVSFQRLATLYKERVLHAGLKTPEADAWLEKLEQVQEKQNNHQNLDLPPNMLGSDINVASIYLGLLYRLLGRDKDSSSLLRTLMVDSLGILSDEELQNDEFALENLVQVFVAADDVDNARALAQSMRKINPMATLDTPVDSPVQKRTEPKLPEIQSTSRSCGQCLDMISLSERFVMCRYCLDSFCTTCLDKIIQADGNRTSDNNNEVVCRSDHDWFEVLPLDRILHTGEILMGDGTVRRFVEWKDMLQKQWVGSPTS